MLRMSGSGAIIAQLGSPPSSPTWVQGNTHQNGASSSTTVAVTLTSPVGSGHMVAVSFGFAAGSGITVSGVSDDKGNTYTVVDTNPVVGAGFTWVTAYKEGLVNGPQTITATITPSTSFGTIMADEFSGIASSSALDVHTFNSINGPTLTADAVTTGNVTTTANGELIYGSCVSSASQGINAGTGFTQDQNVASTFISEHLVQTSAGARAATFTALGVSGWFLDAIMTFKHA